MIGAGDLVYVAKPSHCCGSMAALGWVFKVPAIHASPGLVCVHCEARESGGVLVSPLPQRPGCVIEVSRLKKMPPLNERPDLYGAERGLSQEFFESYERNLQELLTP